MERYRRGKGKQRLLGSHAKCWVWGRNAVLETLAAGRWPILELYLADTVDAAQVERAREALRPRGLIPVVEPAAELTRRCHSAEHQGFLAKMAEFPYRLEAEVLAGPDASRPPCYAILDGVQDPYNFGAILRSAEVFGVHGIFLGERGQVGVTSMVARSSAGAVNRVSICRVARLDELAGRLRAKGITVIGSSAQAEVTIEQCDLRRPVALAIGNEGRGMSADLAPGCDLLVKIPQQGVIGSLNAAVAASILFYEVQRQRLARV